MERRLTTILSADVVGYSRLVREDEAGTLAVLKLHRKELIQPKADQYHGRTIKLMGDGALMEFASVVEAVAFAVEVQCAMRERNGPVPKDRRIEFRIGINVGDIVVDGDDIYGDGVNIAARLEGLADSGGICVRRNVHNQVHDKLDLTFEDLGDVEVKNIAQPIRPYKVVLDEKAEQLVTPIAIEPARHALPRIAIAAGLAGLVALASLAWWQPWSEPDVEPASVNQMVFPLPEKPSIAVLPFDNLSDDPEQSYFADGMTEDLITDLSKISGLFVIARNSSFAYKGQPVNVRQVAEELGVRYVLEGSVRRAGNEVRINAQLIDATTRGHLWAERYDGTLENIFDLQDQVTEKIVSALAISLSGEEQTQLTRRSTDNAEAHDAYLHGWARYKLLTPDDLAAAVPFFEEAIRLDPDYAQAHAAIASLYWDVVQNDWAFDLGMPSRRAEEFANTHLQKALEKPTPLAHALQARILASWGFYDDAVVEAEKAVALDANDATALAGLADALLKAYRPAEAASYIERAMRLDPHYPPSYLTILGGAQFGMEKFDEAASTFERAAKRNLTNELPLIYLASTYGHLGRIEDADYVIEKANELRNLMGLGELSLRNVDTYAIVYYDVEVDFSRFGSKPVRELVRAGLIDIPLLKWQYLVTAHAVLGPGNDWFEVEGATQIELSTAKQFYDRGVPFIDTSATKVWKDMHIPGAVHLPYYESGSEGEVKFRKNSLREVADYDDEIVLYYAGTEVVTPAWEAAKAVAWGFSKVYYFDGGAKAWKDAGYPIESGP